MFYFFSFIWATRISGSYPFLFFCQNLLLTRISHFKNIFLNGESKEMLLNEVDEQFHGGSFLHDKISRRRFC